MKRILMIAFGLIIISAPFAFSQRKKSTKPSDSPSQVKPVVTTSKVSKLTRSSAAQLIRNKLKLPKYEDRPLVLFKRGSDLTSLFQPLVTEGLVTTRMEPPWSNPNAEPWMLRPTSRTSLTDKGKQFAVGEPFVLKSGSGPLQESIMIKLALVDVGEVTGITTGDVAGTMMAEYTLVRKPTPFWKVFKINPAITTMQQAYFKKYDDGWRLVR